VGGNSLDTLLGFPWYEGPFPETDAAYAAVVREYFEEDADEVLKAFPPLPTPKLAFQTLNSRLCVTCPTKILVEAVGKKWPVFLYEFSFDTLEPGYAGHGYEIPEVFGYYIFPFPFNQELSNVMIDYWTSFSVSGVPKSSGAVEWPDYRIQKGYVRLDLRVEQEVGYHETECTFWQTYGTTPERIAKMTSYCLQ